MATYYLPDESGWSEDHGEYYWLRLKVEQSYDSGSNTSTLVITPQAKKNGDALLFHVLDNTYLRVGGTTLLAKQSDAGTGDTGYRFNHTGTDWTDMTQGNGSVKSFTTAVAHGQDGSASVVFETHGRFAYSSSVSRSFFDNGDASLSLSGNASYTLTVSAGTGAAVTVTRGGTALASGATVRYGDVLTVSFAAQAGYDLTSHTVNGTSFTSGGTHTVTGNVTAAATAALKTYTLTVSAGTGAAVTVTRGGTALASGATLTHGDVLTVSFAALRGYALTGHTLNGASFTSGGTHTVTGAVSVSASARLLGAVRLDTGGSLQTYVLRLDTGSAYVPVKLFVDLGTQLKEV